ncbi:MAG: hypothetical protein AAF603_02320, partial [Pseudomonadota bacterium]
MSLRLHRSVVSVLAVIAAGLSFSTAQPEEEKVSPSTLDRVLARFSGEYVNFAGPKLTDAVWLDPNSLAFT